MAGKRTKMKGKILYTKFLFIVFQSTVVMLSVYDKIEVILTPHSINHLI
jgi:hypothetical protein